MKGRHRPHGGGKRGDIQGLRAVAVIAVVAYHVGIPGFAGGFTGVDCFFVISGFLITGSLVADVQQTGRVQFAQFYARRARRILPAAVVVLLATGAASVAWLAPLQARQVLRDCLASAVFVGNYRFAALGTDYLSAESTPSPVQHFWSLGVEEQFYLCWPLLITLAVTTGRLLPRLATGRESVGPRRTVPVGCAVALALVVVASFSLGVILTRSNPPMAFFSMLTRAWELGAGGLLALGWSMRDRIPPTLLWLLGWGGAGALVWSITQLSDASAFPGVVAAVPVLGAVCVIAGAGTGRGGVAALLARQPLRHLGDVSYSWYLWHWPLLVLAPAALGHSLGRFGRVEVVLVALVLAEFTYSLVENPVRFAPLLRPAWRALPAGVALLVVGVVGCTTETTLLPSTTGRGPSAAALSLPPAGSPPPSSAASSHAVGVRRAVTAVLPPWQREDQQLAPLLAQALRPRAVPSNLSPSLDDAAGDKAPPFVDGCNLTWTAVTQPTCTYTNGSPTVVIMGDSHAAQWYPPLYRIAVAQHLRLQSFTKTTCPPLQIPVYSPYLGRNYTECEQWRTQSLDRIKAEHPGLVVLGVARHYDQQYGFTVYSKQWVNGLAATVRELTAVGIHVLVMGPTPKPPADVPTCLSAHLGNVSACDFSRATGVDAAGLNAERRAVLAAGGSYADVSPWLCTSTTCAVVVGNMLLYRDDNHLTTTYTAWLQPLIQPMVDAALRGEHVDAHG